MKKRLSLLSIATVFTMIMTSCGSSSTHSDKNDRTSNVSDSGIIQVPDEKISSKPTLEQAQKYACAIGIAESSKLAAGLHTDGTVVVAGDTDNECDVSDWSNIKAIAVGDSHIVGLRPDGTVVATGSNNHGQCEVNGWHDIVAISAASSCTIGLKTDGTVVAAGDNDCGQGDVYDWDDIVAVDVGYDLTMGLHSDGTVVSTHYDEERYSDWEDITAVTVGMECAGLKTDGTVRVTGKVIAFPTEEELSDWTDIVYIKANADSIIGLKADGTVVAKGDFGDEFGEKRVQNWKDIITVDTGVYCSIGLKSDGTIIATGEEELVSEISKWKNIGIPSFDAEVNNDPGNTASVSTAENTPLTLGDDVDIYSLDVSEVSDDVCYKIKYDYFQFDEDGKTTESYDGILYHDRNDELIMSTYTVNDQQVVGDRIFNTYDEEGNLITQKWMWCDIHNEPYDYKVIIEREYGKNGVLISDKRCDENGNLTYELTSVVDEKNRPVSSASQTYSSGISTAVEYSDLDEYGNYTTKVEVIPDYRTITTTYEYNSYGNVTREERIECDNAGVLVNERITETEYDENGKILKETTCWSTDYDHDGKTESEGEWLGESVREYQYVPNSMSYFINTYTNGVLREMQAYDYDVLVS